MAQVEPSEPCQRTVGRLFPDTLTSGRPESTRRIGVGRRWSGVPTVLVSPAPGRRREAAAAPGDGRVPRVEADVPAAHNQNVPDSSLHARIDRGHAARLSPRQVHMLAGAARGQTNEQIATALGIKRATVSSTLLRTGRTLGTGSRAGMVHRAYQCGIMAGLTPENRPPLCLPPAQHAVLRHLADGYSARDIAHTLAVSENTVKTHLRKIFAALGAASRSHAVALAWQHGLLP